MITFLLAPLLALAFADGPPSCVRTELASAFVAKLDRLNRVARFNRDVRLGSTYSAEAIERIYPPLGTSTQKRPFLNLKIVLPSRVAERSVIEESGERLTTALIRFKANPQNGLNDLVSVASEHLENQGIAHRIFWNDAHMEGFDKKPYIEIIPNSKSPHRISRMSALLKKKFNVRLFYDPLSLMKSESIASIQEVAPFFAWKKQRYLNLPADAVFDVELGSLSVNHEVIHALHFNSSEKKQYNVFNAQFDRKGAKTPGLIPYGALFDSAEPLSQLGYNKYFHLSELEAYSYEMRANSSSFSPTFIAESKNILGSESQLLRPLLHDKGQTTVWLRTR